jgi:hypothetical protein
LRISPIPGTYFSILLKPERSDSLLSDVEPDG